MRIQGVHAVSSMFNMQGGILRFAHEDAEAVGIGGQPIKKREMVLLPAAMRPAHLP